MLREWTNALFANWNSSKSFHIMNQINLLDTKFWKIDIVSLEEFKKIADTGDILLFKGSSFTTKL